MYYPTRAEFSKLAVQGNLIPVTTKLLADLETPLSAYRKLRGQGESFLFESVEGGEHIGRYSFVGCNPIAVIRQNGDTVEYRERGKLIDQCRVAPQKDNTKPPAGTKMMRDGLDMVERVLAKYRPVALPSLPRFTGGAVGFIGYEFIHDIESVVPRPPKDELRTPTISFIIADELLVFDRVSQTLTLLVNAFVEKGASPESVYDQAVARLEQLVTRLDKPIAAPPVRLSGDPPSLAFESNVSKDRFLANVRKAKEYITAGDIIQVVGSQRFQTAVRANPLDIYRAVRPINPSPYMFLLELDGFSLVGASPEVHVRCENRDVTIRPIAGTRRRGRTAEQDAALEQELLADPKERAEHVMLVDLARNDIGRVCEFGSVKVQEKNFMKIERYSHVMHIVSEVEGRLDAAKTPFDLMRATFPAGTLSGAPKIRAMQIISELEGTTRGPYGGCVGYFSFSGNLDCCIAIRTALIQSGVAWVQAGGGWVNDSVPEAEFDETVNKAKAMLKAIAIAEGFAGSGT